MEGDGELLADHVCKAAFSHSRRTKQQSVVEPAMILERSIQGDPHLL
jgi:hypothetical protein